MDTRNAIQKRAAEVDPAPATVWHLTTSENALASIMREGFTAPFGNYFSEHMENAARFLAVRGEYDAYAIQVETEGLPFERSYDHSAMFYGTDDSWVCWQSVPASAIVDVKEISFGPA